MADNTDDIVYKVVFETEEARKETTLFLKEIEKQAEATGKMLEKSVNKGYKSIGKESETTAKKTASVWSKAVSSMSKGKSSISNFVSRSITSFKKLNKSATKSLRKLGGGLVAFGRTASASIATATAGISLLIGGLVAAGAAVLAFTKDGIDGSTELKDSFKANMDGLKEAAGNVNQALSPLKAAIGEVVSEVSTFVTESILKFTELEQVEDIFVNIAAFVRASFEASKVALSNFISDTKIFILDLEIFKNNTIGIFQGIKEATSTVFRGGGFQKALKDFESTRKKFTQENEALKKNVESIASSQEKTSVAFVTAFQSGVVKYRKVAENYKAANKEVEDSNDGVGASAKRASDEIEAQAGSLAALKKQLSEVEKIIQNIDPSSELVSKLIGDKVKLEEQIKEIEELYNRLANPVTPVQVDRLVRDTTLRTVATEPLNTDVDTSGLEKVDFTVPNRTLESYTALAQRANAAGEAFSQLGSGFGELSQTFEEGSAIQVAALKLQQVAAVGAAIANVQLALAKGAVNAAGEPISGIAKFLAIVGLISSIGALVSGFKQQAEESTGFYTGGFTGRGNPRDVAGVVHKEEFVSTKDTTRRNRTLLEGMHTGSREKVRAGIENLMLQYDISPNFKDINLIANSEDTKELKAMRKDFRRLEKIMEQTNLHLQRIERKETSVKNNITITQRKNYRRG